MKQLTEKEYYVRGMTALLDAVGGAIDHTVAVHKHTKKEYVPEKTLFVITTDGMENASKVFSADAVRELITSAEENCNWEFVFYGSNFDAVKTARTYGIRAENAMEYESSHAGYRQMHACRSKKLKDFLN